MKVLTAIYENSVFRPTAPVDLPEGSEVTVEPKPAVGFEGLPPHQKRIREVLRQPLDTDAPGLSERHNEYQP